MQQLKAWKIMAGLRGRPAVDPEPFIAAVCSLSRLLAEYPEISEFDVNPVRIGVGGTIMALDARMRTEHGEGGKT